MSCINHDCIRTGIHQCLYLVNHTLTVFRISYSKPFAGSIQYLNGSSTVINQLVHHQRNKEFALQVFHIFRIAQECFKEFLAVSKVIRSKAPEVHAHRSCVRGSCPFAIVVNILHFSVYALNFGTFYHGSQQMIRIGSTDAAGYRSTLAQCISYTEAHHSIRVFSTFGQCRKELAHYLERVTAIEVIAIDHRKRFLYHISSHHDSMVSSPRFCTLRRTSKTLRQIV